MTLKVSRPDENIDEFKAMQTDVHNNIQSLPISPFYRKRKRAARYKKNRAPSPMDMSDQVVATCRESNQPCPEGFSHAADENARLGEDSRISNHDASQGSRYPSIPGSLSSVVEVVTESEYEKVDKDDSEFVKACDLRNGKDNDKLLTDKKELTGPDSGSTENLGLHLANWSSRRLTSLL
ncbi:uncharacterized protein LOC120135795 [Hibiscus syriacus]|nr:uncharacterized protein LOC120135795 [Hibiscus syriacus]